MRTSLVVPLIGILLAAGAFASTVEDPLHRDSPQGAVIGFLQACRQGDYGRAQHYLDLRQLTPDQRLKQGPALSRQLQQTLDRDAQFDVANLSRDPGGDRAQGANRAVVDSFQVAGQKVNLELERVQLRSGAMVWVFSEASVALIPHLSRLASDSPIEKFLPD